jgi:hypothetical protein
MSNKEGVAGADRRNALRKKSLLQGRIFYNNRRSSIDCLIRDFSETGAKLKLSEAIAVPEVMELYVPNKDEFRRARIQWRAGGEIGVAFGGAAEGGLIEPAVASSDVQARMQKLESDIAALKRIVNELRAEIRKSHGEVA